MSSFLTTHCLWSGVRQGDDPRTEMAPLTLARLVAIVGSIV